MSMFACNLINDPTRVGKMVLPVVHSMAVLQHSQQGDRLINYGVKTLSIELARFTVVVDIVDFIADLVNVTIVVIVESSLMFNHKESIWLVSVVACFNCPCFSY